jgi:hypothetical protein
VVLLILSSFGVVPCFSLSTFSFVGELLDSSTWVRHTLLWGFFSFVEG